MKIFFVFLLFLLFLLPSYAQEDKLTDDSLTKDEETKEQTSDSNIQEASINDEEHNIYEYNRMRNKAQVSPKKEHNKILYKVQKKLVKDKQNFNDTKNKELWLLKDEMQILDYKP